MPWRRRRVTQVDHTPPPPRRPLLWPWLLLLLLLVATGIGLAYFLTRDDDESSSANRVPAVVGLREADAVERLRADGYPADVRRAVNPAQVGKVIRQSPSAGAGLEPGNTVVIVVARRPNTVDVPRVVGLDVADAFERVQAAGLRAKSVEVFARQAKGRVVRQRPPAGAEARRGATVVLSVSKGPQLVAVPAVMGQTEADATAALRRVGLRVNIVRVPAPGPVPEGTVVAQNPKGGVKAPKGSTVRLNIAAAARRRLDSDRADDGGGARSERRRLARHGCGPTLADGRFPRLFDSRVVHASSRNGADAVSGGRDHGDPRLDGADHRVRRPAGAHRAGRGRRDGGRCGPHPARRRVHGAGGGQGRRRSRAARARRRAGPRRPKHACRAPRR